MPLLPNAEGRSATPNLRSRPAGHTQGDVIIFSRVNPFVVGSSYAFVNKLTKHKTTLQHRIIILFAKNYHKKFAYV